MNIEPWVIDSLMTCKIAPRMGTIIAVVAVLLIHIERNQQGNMIPSINLCQKPILPQYVRTYNVPVIALHKNRMKRSK